MAPTRLASALSRLQVFVTQTRVADVLGPLRPYSGQPRPELQTALQAFGRVCAEQERFGDAERALIEALQLGAIFESEWWAEIIICITRATMPDELAVALPGLCARLDFVAGSFPALATLLSKPFDAGGRNGITLAVSGYDGEPPELTRVASVLQAVQLLWTVAEALAGVRAPLALTGSEPGAATLLQFDGPTAPLQEMTALLAALPQADPLSGDWAEQAPLMRSVLDRLDRRSHAESMRLRETLNAGVRGLLAAGAALPGHTPVRTSPPATAAPAPIPVSPAFADPPHLAREDLDHLAQVIAEERRALKESAPAPRLWQGRQAQSY